LERIQMIDYKGKTILLEDFSEMHPGPESFETLKSAEKLIRSRPPKSVLALFDATGATFNAAALSALKDFTKGNTPYVKYAVAIGIRGMLKIALAAVAKASNRPFQTFDTREEALEYLVSQD
jgi:hypothetical protein